jgi:NADH-quinone oxidoreductase subunit M
MGWVTIGIFAMQTLGLHGALLHTMACGLATACILLLGKPQDHHLEQPRPKWGQRFAYAIGTLSAIGVPGLAGFVGYSTLVLGFVQVNWQDPIADLGRDVWSIVIALSLLFAAWGLFRAWRRGQAADSAQQTLIVVPLLILLVLAGLYPTLVTDIVGPSIHRLLTQILLSTNVPTDQPDPSVPQLDGEEQFFPYPEQPDGAQLPQGQQRSWHLDAAPVNHEFHLPEAKRRWVHAI